MPAPRPRLVPRLRLAPSLVIAAAVLLPMKYAQAAFALGPPVTSPESASTRTSVSVRVTLEATDDFGADALIAFAIVTEPAHGSLRALEPVSCSSTLTTSDCTATVIYTPTPGYAGPDSFSYQASDQFASSSPSTVTLNVVPNTTAPATTPTPSLTPSIAGGPAFVQLGSAYAANAAGLLTGATVSYGDGASATLAVRADGTSALSHVYLSEGSYVVTVANPPPYAAATALVNVLLPGVASVASGAVGPGATATVGVPGVSATLASSQSDPGSVAIMTATYAGTNPGFVGAGPQGLVLSAFDIRAVGAGDKDMLVVRFSYPATPGNPAPTLEFFDASRGAYVPVRGSAGVSNSFLVEPVSHTVTVVLDDTSEPTLANLTGTRFAIVGGMPLVVLPSSPQLLLDKRQLRFIASCGPVACRLTATGMLAIPGAAHAERLRRVTVALPAGRYQGVRMTTSRALRAVARDYLNRRRGPLNVRLQITVAGPGHLRRSQRLVITTRTLPGRR